MTNSLQVHHPIPQHVSTVPQLRSPPPPQPPSQPQSGYGYGQQGGGMPQQGGGYNMHPAFGGFMNDPTAQIGLQFGKTAMDAGQQYMEQNVRPPGPSRLPPCSDQLTLCSSAALSPSPLSNTTSTSPTHTSSPSYESSSSRGGTARGHVSSVTTPIPPRAALRLRCTCLREKMSTARTCTFRPWPS